MGNRSTLINSGLEHPSFFPAGEHTLFGIHTPPARPDSTDIGAILLSGGGSPVSANRNRVSVSLCRRLASQGVHAFRFDYHGIGESSGRVEGFRLDRPFKDDLMAAVRWMGSRGASKIILIGSSCFGARTALAAAPELADLKGVVLGTAPVRDFEMGDRVTTRMARELGVRDYLREGVRLRNLRRLVKPKWRHFYSRAAKAKLTHEWKKRSASNSPNTEEHLNPVSPSFATSLLHLQQQDTPTLFVYGDQDDFYPEFLRARDSALANILSPEERWWTLVTLSGHLHGFTQVAAQDGFIDLACNWVRKVVRPPGPKAETRGL